MAENKRDLAAAKLDKKDEFYTQLTDIEKEMRYYRKHFKDKTILCNCDDPFESNFFKYFVLNFNRLGLKKLIATCYAGSPMDKYCPDQFKIIGLGITDLGKSIGVGDYDRKYKTPASRDGTLYYVKDGKGVVPYARVLIQNKHPEEVKK